MSIFNKSSQGNSYVAKLREKVNNIENERTMQFKEIHGNTIEEYIDNKIQVSASWGNNWCTFHYSDEYDSLFRNIGSFYEDSSDIKLNEVYKMPLGEIKSALKSFCKNNGLKYEDINYSDDKYIRVEW